LEDKGTIKAVLLGLAFTACFSMQNGGFLRVKRSTRGALGPTVAEAWNKEENPTSKISLGKTKKMNTILPT
jgi:hypothetical protein